MLISVEHEMPAVNLDGSAGIEPELFVGLWKELCGEGWMSEGSHAVSRQVAYPHPHAKKPLQMISTDTGPTIEIAPSPAETIDEIGQQLKELRALIVNKLRSKKVGLLGSGVNPTIGTTLDEYYQYRTPRIAYDYAIQERGWHHQTMLNIAAMQEVLDIPFVQAPAILAVMHRLAGVMLFLNRNDPDLARHDNQKVQRTLSIRPAAWREQVPVIGPFANDRFKVYLPMQEVNTWRSYLHLLWSANPMFILGTKSNGLVYVPEHPIFATFMSSPPSEGWKARQLDTCEDIRVMPDMSHVKQTDWTYMGFARLRLFWKDETTLSDLVRAYHGDDGVLEAFLSSQLEKVLLENRTSASPPPGDEMCSPALVVGLVENFNATESFVKTKPYSFWLKLAQAAERAPMTSRVEGIEVTELLAHVLSLSRVGLLHRGCGEEEYLKPLFRRIREGQSPSEQMLRFYAAGKEEAVIENLIY